MDLKYVRFEKKDKVGYILMDNPSTLNAITVASAPEITYCVNDCSDDDDIRAIVIRGANGKFCGGGDVKAMKARNDAGKPGNNAGIRKYVEMILSIRNADKPVIAWLEGPVAGGGVSLAMACDFLIADENCKFVFSFINVGYVPDMGSMYLLTRSVGKTKATELFMLGNQFNGKEAKEWGIVTEAVPADELEGTVMRYLYKLSNGPTLAYARIKKLMNRSIYDGIANSMFNEGEYQYYLSHTQDHQNAINAFFEKKRATFIGK